MAVKCARTEKRRMKRRSFRVVESAIYTSKSWRRRVINVEIGTRMRPDWCKAEAFTVCGLMV